MRALMAGMTGAGVPLGLAGLLCGIGWMSKIHLLKFAGMAGLGSSLILGPLGAFLGLLVIRRRVSPTPFRDALQVASILPAILTLVAVLPISHAEGALAGLICAPLVFLPGPVAAGVAARLWQASEPRA